MDRRGKRIDIEDDLMEFSFFVGCTFLRHRQVGIDTLGCLKDPPTIGTKGNIVDVEEGHSSGRRKKSIQSEDT